jgi:transposase-like protein
VSQDATYCKGRVEPRVLSQAAVIPTGVDRRSREVLGIDVGALKGALPGPAHVRMLSSLCPLLPGDQGADP